MKRLIGCFLLGTLFLSHQSVADTWYEGRLQQETINLIKNPHLVQRDKNKLSLKLSSGEQLVLSNRELCDEGPNDCVYYWYRGLIANEQLYWVSVSYYEGKDELLISRKSGKQYQVIDEPHISPDGKYIVSASAAEAYDPAGVFLWEIRKGALIRKLHFEPKEYGLYRFMRWNGSKIVELTKTAHAPEGFYSADCPSSFSLVEFPVRLIFKQERWTLDESMDNKKLKCQQ